MNDKARLYDEYADLLRPDDDPGMLRLVGTLDAIGSTGQPPAGTSAAIQRAIEERSRGAGTGITTYDASWEDVPEETGIAAEPRTAPERRERQGRGPFLYFPWLGGRLNPAGAAAFLMLLGAIVVGLATLLPRMQGTQVGGGNQVPEKARAVIIDRTGDAVRIPPGSARFEQLSSAAGRLLGKLTPPEGSCSCGPKVAAVAQNSTALVVEYPEPGVRIGGRSYTRALLALEGSSLPNSLGEVFLANQTYTAHSPAGVSTGEDFREFNAVRQALGLKPYKSPSDRPAPPELTEEENVNQLVDEFVRALQQSAMASYRGDEGEARDRETKARSYMSAELNSQVRDLRSDLAKLGLPLPSGDGYSPGIAPVVNGFKLKGDRSSLIAHMTGGGVSRYVQFDLQREDGEWKVTGLTPDVKPPCVGVADMNGDPLRDATGKEVCIPQEELNGTADDEPPGHMATFPGFTRPQPENEAWWTEQGPGKTVTLPDGRALAQLAHPPVDLARSVALSQWDGRHSVTEEGRDTISWEVVGVLRYKGDAGMLYVFTTRIVKGDFTAQFARYSREVQLADGTRAWYATGTRYGNQLVVIRDGYAVTLSSEELQLDRLKALASDIVIPK